MIHYTLNTARSIESLRLGDTFGAIEEMRALVHHGGSIPNHKPYRMTILHSPGSDVFTVRRGRDAIEHCMLAWNLGGEAAAWTTIENLYRSAAASLPGLRFFGALAQKPISLPWLGVVLLTGLANQPHEIVCWLGEFERSMGWAVLSQREDH